jgi:hypothetical protein
VHAVVLNGGQPGAVTAGPSDANALTLQTNGAAHMTIDSSGNVGIGVTDPAERLEIKDLNPMIRLTTNSAAGVAGINFEDSTGAVEWALGFRGTDEKFYIGNDNQYPVTNARLVIDNSGNVGIGTTNPGEKLEVAGNIKVTGDSKLSQVTETAVDLGAAVSGAVTLDLKQGTYFYGTITGATTFSVTNNAPTGFVSSFTLELTNAGASSLTWMSGTKWPSGSPPTLTASGTDIIVCSTRDGAATWRCVGAEIDSH